MKSTYVVLSYSYTMATAKLMAKVFMEPEKSTEMCYLTQDGGGGRGVCENGMCDVPKFVEIVSSSPGMGTQEG